MSLNWLNDPLLLDQEPVPATQWQTANKLIKNNLIRKDVSNQLKLNLFSILVRKIDFYRENDSDRILSRFPFLVLKEEEIALIKKNILLIAEFARDYFYKSITSRIGEWQKRLQTYLERGAIPYPLFRCACEILQLPTVRPKSNKLTFESARGKRYTIPTKLTKQLAYICGVVNGDGHLHHHWLRVIDETKEHIQQLSKVFDQLFSDPGEIFQTGNAWNVEIRSSSAVRLINFLTDQTIKGAKYNSLKEPEIFKMLDEPYRSLYWRGAMDADGSFKQHISFASASKKYVMDFNDYLHSKGVYSKISLIGDYAHCLTIPAIFRFNFIKLIGVSNPKKKADMQQLFNKIQCQFRGLNSSKLINGLYFNLLELHGLNVIGFNSYLVSIRANKTIFDRSKELSIAPNQYSAYERGSRAIPIRTAQSIVGKGDEEFLKLLISLQSSLFFRISSSNLIKLPFIITPEIIQIMSILQPVSNYAKILFDDTKTLQSIQEIFEIKARDNRLNSRLIVNFLTTFGIYKKPDFTELAFESIM